jgi:AGZA family xanthine/uracil permease-like MFS transporter
MQTTDTSRRVRWAAAGDLSAFFALALDNLTNIVLLAAILIGGFGFPADVFFQKMVPGTALGVCLGDLAYTWMAIRLARKTGRDDVTAMPLGLDTPSTVGVAVAILGPTFKATGDAMLTWYVGMATMVFMGVVKVATSFLGGALQRIFPQASLLGSIGGVGLVLLGFLPLTHIFEAPIVGLAALGLVVYTLIARLPLPGRLPGAALAVLVGTALYYGLGAAGLIEKFVVPSLTLSPAAPLPTLDFVHGVSRAVDFLPLAIPFALLTIVGGINVTESARVAGDDYRTRDILLVEAGVTLVAGLTGGVAQSTPYIGHPAYKAMGARAAYTLAAGLFVGIGAALGVVQFVAQAIPAAAIAPLLVFVGVEIVSQAYHAPSPKHAAAVTFAFLPSAAEVVRIAISQVTMGKALTGDAAHFAHGVDVLAHGFIVTAMLWGATIADLVDRRVARAGLWCAVASLCTLFGLIHSVVPSGALYLPWTLSTAEPYVIAAGYAVVACMFIALSRTAAARA